MKKLAYTLPALALLAMPTAPLAAQHLNDKQEARVARAAPEDRDAVRYCLSKKNKGQKTGTIAGAAAGAGTAIIAGGNLGVTALSAGAGALAGREIGKGSTGTDCKAVLKRNK